MSDKLIPRMRTAAKIVAELRAMDPGCEVTEYYIRQLIREGAVPVVWAGHKALVNLLQQGTQRPEEEPETIGGIRRLKAI